MRCAGLRRHRARTRRSCATFRRRRSSGEFVFSHRHDGLVTTGPEACVDSIVVLRFGNLDQQRILYLTLAAPFAAGVTEVDRCWPSTSYFSSELHRSPPEGLRQSSPGEGHVRPPVAAEDGARPTLSLHWRRVVLNRLAATSWALSEASAADLMISRPRPSAGSKRLRRLELHVALPHVLPPVLFVGQYFVWQHASVPGAEVCHGGSLDAGMILLDRGAGPRSVAPGCTLDAVPASIGPSTCSHI